ncbi:ParB/RepB/Spo0J family partition protein [Amycolatopsis sp. NPDC059021]|uniref:ParB/RepB/Spo0J family partition protein n=1 Tax=Amycolatopsis sp. NPDC059021 TaxID=3346704 RepID=UPI003670AEA5
MVALGALRFGDSPRFVIDEDFVLALAAETAVLPPLIVHRPSLRVVDGNHRLLAAQARGKLSVTVTFFDGSAEDAFVLSVYRNISSRFPLSEAERHAAADRIRRTHPHWPLWTIRALAGLPAAHLEGQS